jgi:hypothetical protein
MRAKELGKNVRSDPNHSLDRENKKVNGLALAGLLICIVTGLIISS